MNQNHAIGTPRIRAVNTHSKIKVSDIPPTTLRLSPELKDRLTREAMINRRSLSQEAELRLEQSFRPAGELEELPAFQMKEHLPAYSTASTLTDSQRLLISLFAKMPTEKQLALITLLQR
ncbi:TraY domain-containing protein [Paucibacter sp. B51]|uniref:TraY domain-containing protein n=1 Tax=Paucibacter sp. B51 TaxID=2993315 RepID=UPI0022EBC3CD|nr:TraY domain-containing protein [Paucibacter sp. B51]